MGERGCSPEFGLGPMGYKKAPKWASCPLDVCVSPLDTSHCRKELHAHEGGNGGGTMSPLGHGRWWTIVGEPGICLTVLLCQECWVLLKIPEEDCRLEQWGDYSTPKHVWYLHSPSTQHCQCASWKRAQWYHHWTLLLWDWHQVTYQHWCPEAFAPVLLVRRSMSEKGLSLVCSPLVLTYWSLLTLPLLQSMQGH